MRVALSSLYLRNDLSLLKLAALYADTIVVPDVGGAVADPVDPDKPIVMGQEVLATVKFVAHTLPEFVRQELQPLFSEGIAILDERQPTPQIDESPFYEIFDRLSDRYYDRHGEWATVLPLEMKLVAVGLSACARRDKPIDDEFHFTYFYALQAHAVLQSALRHRACPITDSQIVRDLVAAYGQAHDQDSRGADQVTAALSKAVLIEALPGVADAPIEDILEVRRLMADELGLFRTAMAKLSGLVAARPWEVGFDREIERIVSTSIIPAATDLRRRLRAARRRSVSRIFDNLQDPKTYVPLVGTLVAGISPSVAVAASVGISAFRAIYDLWLETTELKQENGLIFLCEPRGPARNWAA